MFRVYFVELQLQPQLYFTEMHYTILPVMLQYEPKEVFIPPPARGRGGLPIRRGLPPVMRGRGIVRGIPARGYPIRGIPRGVPRVPFMRGFPPRKSGYQFQE